MKLFFLIFIFSFNSFAEIVKIESGKDYKKYSNEDLRRRVYDLEQAVWQLQQKVYEIQIQHPEVDGWICSVKAMGNTHTGTGVSKAVAIAASIDACKKAHDGSAFHCSNPKCEQ